MKFKVIIMYDPEYQGYIVDVPELMGCMSQGKTMDDAISNIKDAIKGWLYVRRKAWKITSSRGKRGFFG